MPNIETIWAWLWPWAVGLLFSLYIGHLVIEVFLDSLHKRIGHPQETEGEVPREVTGVIERLLFTILVGAGVEGFPTAMIAWLALKMASNWNFVDRSTEPSSRPFALAALLAGVISMLFAFLGGMTRRFFACLS